MLDLKISREIYQVSSPFSLTTSEVQILRVKLQPLELFFHQFPIPLVLPELAEQILLRISYAPLTVNLASEDTQSSFVSMLLALESLDLVEFALYVVFSILNVGLE